LLFQFGSEQGCQWACQAYFPLGVILTLRFVPASPGCDHK